jgi:hypothetical protein
MRRSARTDLCGGRSVMLVPTASIMTINLLRTLRRSYWDTAVRLKIEQNQLVGVL